MTLPSDGLNRMISGNYEDYKMARENVLEVNKDDVKELVKAQRSYILTRELALLDIELFYEIENKRYRLTKYFENHKKDYYLGTLENVEGFYKLLTTKTFEDVCAELAKKEVI